MPTKKAKKATQATYARKYEAIQTPRYLKVIGKARRLADMIAKETEDPRPVPIYMAVLTAIDEALDDRT